LAGLASTPIRLEVGRNTETQNENEMPFERLEIYEKADAHYLYSKHSFGFMGSWRETGRRGIRRQDGQAKFIYQLDCRSSEAHMLSYSR
jgi:hypothetical protein